MTCEVVQRRFFLQKKSANGRNPKLHQRVNPSLFFSECLSRGRKTEWIWSYFCCCSSRERVEKIYCWI